MIVLQPEIDTRPVKIDWYWSTKKPTKDDGKLQEVYPFFVINETRYMWEGVEW